MDDDKGTTDLKRASAAELEETLLFALIAGKLQTRPGSSAQTE
jgi:hypothetical protein